MKVGYARCSTDEQDLTSQRNKLAELGVAADRIYLDQGLTGANRKRPSLREALAACHEGDTLVVTKLDRLARSGRDARDIIEDDLHKRGVLFALGPTVYDWSDPFAKMFLSMLATFAEFELDLIRMRTREGMAVARAKGKLKGKPPKLSSQQRELLLVTHAAGRHNIVELADLFGISRPTVYRELARAKGAVVSHA